jgi:protoporphyrinogen oxidase
MNIAIIGGGLTGLTSAYDFASAGHRVTIFESATILGGLAAGFRDKDWQWSLEGYYHHLFTSDHAILDLIQHLHQSHKVIFRSPQTVSAYRNQYFPLDSPLAILRFPGLSFLNKLRFGLITAYLKYLAPWQPLERVSAQAWLSRWYGMTIYQTIWQPLLVGKFGTYTQSVNMAWMWARLKARTPTLGTYKGGFSALITDISKELITLGVSIKLNQKVKSIEPQKSGPLKIFVDNEGLIFDQVLLTVSPPIALSLVPKLPIAYKQRLAKLKHLGALTVILALKKPLSPQGYYWYNLVKTPKSPFLALVEHTNFVPSKHFNGDYLVYIADYAPPTDRRFYQTKSALINLTLPLLKSINPHFDNSWIRKSWVNRTPYAQPIPELNHSQHLPSLKTPISGLYLANMSQIYPWDRGTNYAVDLGHKVAKLMTTL